jgi:ABC-type amino acid transport substrate-binding protein
MKITFTLIFLTSFLFSLELSKDEKIYLEKKKVITMCVDPDWYPFEKIENGKHIGLSADLIALVQKQLGTPIQLLVTQTWDESLEFSKSRKCDIMSFLNDTPDRRVWLTFTEPLFNDPNVLVGRIENEYIENIGTIKASIALPRGTAMAELFARDFPNLTIIPTTTETEAFKLVEEKKADLTLRSLVMSAYTIKNDGIFNLKIIGWPEGYENHLRIGVRNDEAILKDIFNKAIANIKKEEVETILDKYTKLEVKKITTLSVGVYVFGGVLFLVALILLWNHLLRKKVSLEVAKNEANQKIIYQKAKQAELGNLIANISHQWRDALSSISSRNLEILAKIEYGYTITQEEMQTNSKEIEKSIGFMSETMHRFLEFYKVSDKTTLFSLGESLHHTFELIKMKLQYHKLSFIIEIKEDFQIEAVKNEWMNIWLNIIVNTMNIALEREIINPQLKVIVENGTITFSDNCGGFDKDVLEQIEKNRNSGLGLSMSKEILKKYNFEMIISNDTMGAKFFIKKVLS